MLIYTGETGQRLRDRHQSHTSAVRTKSKTPVGIHFNSEAHDLSMLRIQGIYKCKETKQHRLQKETMLIKKFLTPLNKQFNTQTRVPLVLPYTAENSNILKKCKNIVEETLPDTKVFSSNKSYKNTYRTICNTKSL